MDANLKALNKVMDVVNYSVKMEKLGETVNSVALENNFNTIHNLSGHQIARYNLHCGLSVPNFKNGDTREVFDNITLAIEPFFTRGEPRVKSSGSSNILHLNSDKPVRDPIAKKVLQFIRENYQFLPFSKRWLLSDIREKLGLDGGFDKRKVLYALRVLKSQKIIFEYDALSSVDGEYITQFEDTVMFLDNKKEIITRL
jgi:methionyl aminopeptidase